MKIKAKNVSFHKEYVFTKRPALVYFDDRVGSYPIMYFRRPKSISQEVFNDLIERVFVFGYVYGLLSTCRIWANSKLRKRRRNENYFQNKRTSKK